MKPMQKPLLLLIALLMLTPLACTPQGTAHMDTNRSQTVSDVLDAASAEPQTTSQPAPERRIAASDGITVDIDLTAMSSTMVYSQVYDMVNHPEDYLGKTVKMEGLFAVYEGDERNYYSCIITDAAACCAQGMEFVPAIRMTYPGDFPAIEAPITVIGTFDTYREDEYVFCQLIDALLL